MGGGDGRRRRFLRGHAAEYTRDGRARRRTNIAIKHLSAGVGACTLQRMSASAPATLSRRFSLSLPLGQWRRLVDELQVMESDHGVYGAVPVEKQLERARAGEQLLIWMRCQLDDADQQSTTPPASATRARRDDDCRHGSDARRSMSGRDSRRGADASSAVRGVGHPGPETRQTGAALADGGGGGWRLRGGGGEPPRV